MSTAMIWQTLSTSSDETERLGELLGKTFTGGEVIELRSDLGGGKTTFVKGLAKGAGSKAHVTSPTFTLNRVYKAENFDIHHFDFYRLSDPGILREQLAESVDNGKAVTIIEWADVVNDVLPDQKLTIELKPTVISPDERRITFTYPKEFITVITKIENQWQVVEP